MRYWKFALFLKWLVLLAHAVDTLVVPKALRSDGASLNSMWSRQQTTKYNEVPYVVQKAAEAVFSAEGYKASLENVEYYTRNAAVIGKALEEVGVWYCGAKNSPYIWMECPNGMKSWEFLMCCYKERCRNPRCWLWFQWEGYFRLTGFGDAQRTVEAASRLKVIQEL